MSELRQNPLTGEWVIIAEDRSLRPHELALENDRHEVPPFVDTCPFCAGNESDTPPAILEMPGETGLDGWQIRVFANKYAALAPDSSPAGPTDSELFVAIPGNGAHEVIVESPLHNRSPFDRSIGETRALVEAYLRRCVDLKSRPSTKYVTIFKNQGVSAGASLEHPHSQVMATPVLPQSARLRGELASQYYRKTGQCLVCHLVNEELHAGTRIVSSDGRYAVFCPFAASRPAEVWIVPLDHDSAFDELTSDRLDGLASNLNDTIRRLSAGFGEPDFNYVIHSSPCDLDDDSRPYWHWYLQVLPRITIAAGFELGTGIYINTMPPETSARAMRNAADSLR